MEYYRALVKSAREMLAEKSTDERAWFLIEKLGTLRLHGGKAKVKDKDLVRKALNHFPIVLVAVREKIEKWLERSKEGCYWEDEENTIPWNHTSLIAGFLLLSEVILDDPELLPGEINSLDRAGEQVNELNKLIKDNLTSFLEGKDAARSERFGVERSLLTNHYVFLSRRFLSMKKPRFAPPPSPRLCL